MGTIGIRDMGDRTPYSLPIQWWATDNYVSSEHSAQYSNACVVWSLLTSALVSRNPEKRFLTLPERDVINVYDQYVDIMRDCFPLLKIIVSESFKVDANFLANHAGTLWHCVRWESKGDYPCTSRELNDSYMDDLEGKPNEMKWFRALVEMYYGQKITSEDISQDLLRSQTEDFLELRKALFEIWAEIIAGEVEKKVNEAATEEESAADRGEKIEWKLRFVNKFLNELGTSVELQEKCPNKLKEKCRQGLQEGSLEYISRCIEILEFIHQEVDLHQRYWAEVFGDFPQLIYDRQIQEDIILEKMNEISTKTNGIYNSSIFLLGLTRSLYWDGQLWEHCALHLHSTRSLRSRTSYLKKGYFDGDSKCVLNIMLIPQTPTISDQGKPYLKTRHAVSLVPAEGKSCWITQVYEVENAKKFIREQAEKLCGLKMKYSSSQFPQKVSNGKSKKYQRELTTFWSNVEKNSQALMDPVGNIVVRRVHVPRIFRSTIRQEALGCGNSENGDQFVSVPFDEKEWKGYFGNYRLQGDPNTNTLFCLSDVWDQNFFKKKIEAVANVLQKQKEKK